MLVTSKINGSTATGLSLGLQFHLFKGDFFFSLYFGLVFSCLSLGHRGLICPPCLFCLYLVYPPFLFCFCLDLRQLNICLCLNLLSISASRSFFSIQCLFLTHIISNIFHLFLLASELEPILILAPSSLILLRNAGERLPTVISKVIL